ncbi:terminase small subunit [Pedobacter sp. HDW13]|uniref:terminase small subunit n=1 Tax=Pedobacter sp. HDW13 TaxID=2714940 RepID=UPI00140E7765|nr:terminase small subunit [Pedobacter sp. HDW13]QIL41015.1 terminase small subunit [Pedobacter sp. HDW13]
MRELTEKQKRFCEEYLIDLNATQAAIRAGYSIKTANEQGARLLANVSIQSYMSGRQKELQASTNITQQRVLEEYAKIAFVDIREVFETDGGIHNVKQLDDFTAGAISSIESIEEKFQGVTIGTVRKVKFHDKIRALDALGKHLGLFLADNKQKEAVNHVTVNLGGGVNPDEATT